MSKAAIVVLADIETHGDMGRIANALEAVKEFKEGGDDVQLIFDGAGTQWVPELLKEDSELKPLYEAVQDKTSGVCGFCAKAFGVKQKVHELNVPFLEEYDGHPSIKKLVDQGYQVITF